MGVKIKINVFVKMEEVSLQKKSSVRKWSHGPAQMISIDMMMMEKSPEKV